MADNKQKSKDNLIDLASERQRLQQRAQVQKGKKLARATKGPEKKSGSNKIQWYHYFQLVLFLMVFAYFMHQCRGGA